MTTTTLLDILETRYPTATRLDDGTRLLREHGRMLRWLASGSETRVRTWLALELPGASTGGYTGSRRSAFLRALAGFAHTHFAAELEAVEHVEPRAELTATATSPDDLTQLLGAIDALWPHLRAMIVAAHAGEDPFAALAERDDAIAAGDRTAPDVSAPAPPTAPTAPTTTPPQARDDGPTTSLEVSGRAITVGLGLDALPASGAVTELSQALLESLRHRFDDRLDDLERATPGHDLSGHRHAGAVRGTVAAGADLDALRDDLADYLERIVTFVSAGLDLVEVLGIEPASPAPPPREAPPPRQSSPRRWPADRPASTPAPPPLAEGDRVDVWLRTPGYSSGRIEQVLCLLLEIDIIQSKALCEAAPCLLMPDVTQARAAELERLVARAGGKAVRSPVGTRPDLGPGRA